VQITVGEPISVTERLLTYQTSHQSSKTLPLPLLQNLQVALENDF